MTKRCPVILQTGFRIFFLGAAVHAVLSMAIWYLFYVAQGNIFVALPLTVWHGHEMIFGYTMAVVAGFLLTAVINWTGQPTLSGTPLLILFLFWLLARILAFMPASFPLWPFMLCNIVFFSFLFVGVMRPVIQVKQWRQSAVFSKLFLIFVSGIFVYWAVIQADLLTQRKALRFAVYIMISLIFTIARRVMPFFIEKGVGYEVNLKNSKTFDIASVILLVAFSILDIFWPQPYVIATISLLLVFIHTWRLKGWHTFGIWRKPLLWVLFIGYIFLILGFAFKVMAVIANKPDDAALHAWTAGAIGLFTLGMMARVSWGHTGRVIAQPPRLIGIMFLVLLASAIFRTFLPIINEHHYIMWIAISQLLWMIAFTLYIGLYFKSLTTARLDGKWG